MSRERLAQTVRLQIPVCAFGKHNLSNRATGAHCDRQALYPACRKSRSALRSRILKGAYTNAMSTTSQPNPAVEPIPQFDLSAQYAAIGAEIRAAIERVLATQQFVLGREGAALEEEIAALCGLADGVGVASGTDALILALRSWVCRRAMKCSCPRQRLW